MHLDYWARVSAWITSIWTIHTLCYTPHAYQMRIGGREFFRHANVAPSSDNDRA